VSVDDHDLLIISSDNSNVVPTKVRSFVIHNGERYALDLRVPPPFYFGQGNINPDYAQEMGGEFFLEKPSLG